MNVVFFLMLASSLAVMIFTDPAGAMGALLGGAENAVTLSFKMLAIYALWLGVLGVMRKNGVSDFVSRLFRPVTRRLFKGEKPETLDLISQNLAANFLGIGSAATPLGIRAVEQMQGEQTDATDNAVLFLVVNSCGVQLLPATIIALRGQAGSASPGDVLLPTVLCTALTAGIGILLCFVTRKRRRKPA